MRIEDDGEGGGVSRRMDAIRAAQQARSEASAERLERDIERAESSASIQGDTAQPDLMARELSGAELHDGAVEAAQNQQDRSDLWTSFSDVRESSVPKSIDELARESKEQASDEQRQAERVSVQDMLNAQAIQSGIIKS